jgi:PAS domain S-box-containing protein
MNHEPTNGDYELIHIPGAIQPHGILLVLQKPQLTIVQVSNNTFKILGTRPEKLLGKNLDCLFDRQQIESIEQNIVADNLNPIAPIALSINKDKNTLFCDGIFHHFDSLIILELENFSDRQDFNIYTFERLVRAPLLLMEKAPSMESLSQTIVKEIRKLTGFDRVMLYQFDTDSSGKVIAEDKLETLETFLDLHYPAIDIPPVARELYTQNSICLIPDVNYQAAELIPNENPIIHRPLDLSLSVLRSLSPCHLQYLKNMGVTASMSISLIKNRQLWGLISCHHQAPKYVSNQIRLACEFLGKFMVLELAAQEKNEIRQDKIQLTTIKSELFQALSKNNSFIETLLIERDNLLDLCKAQGAVICSDENLNIIGKTPDLEDLNNLMAWVEKQINDDIFVTDSLPKLYPPAEQFKDVASGLLALCISKNPKYYILWFRPEVIQTVNWAGNPEKSITIDLNGRSRLSPRNSFDLWQETVSLTSLPWKNHEIEISLALRGIIVENQLQKINQQLTLALEAAQLGFWDWNLLTGRILWSRGHEDLFGLEKGAFAGTYQAMLSCIHPEDRQAVESSLFQSREQRRDYHQEFRVAWADGSIHWIEGKGKFFYEKSGRAIRMMGTVREVSDRKQAEAALKQINEELETRVQERTADLERSQAALRQKMERERLMIAIAQQMRQSLELSEMLNTTVTEVQKLLRADRVLVYRVLPNLTGSVIAEAAAPGWTKLLGLTYSERGCSLETRQPYARSEIYSLRDRERESIYPCLAEFLEQIQVRAKLVVPIVQQNNLWGLLIVHQCSGSREWQSWEIDLLQQLASQMAIAVKQSELYQLLQEELKQRQRVEEALRQNEALFRSLSESSPVGIFRLDERGKCIYTNPRYQEISGFTFEETLGDNWKQFIHTEDLEGFWSDWSASVALKQEFSAELRYLEKEGTIRFCRLRTAPILAWQDKLIGHVGTIEDITESRTMEKMQSEFISIVSHELRTPLASIRGSLGLLAAGIFQDRPESAQQMLDIAASDTERLVRLVNDILDLDRLESSKVNLLKQWCDTATILQKSVEAIHTTAAENQINLSIEPSSLKIWADPDRIVQTIVNLLSNAIKFSPPESTVTLRVEDLTDRVLFAVSDRGRGIPPDKLETIFGRFQQVDASDSRQKGGTGLGLAICRSIVQQHGGRIWVESKLGKGSSFYFTLPIPLE